MMVMIVSEIVAGRRCWISVITGVPEKIDVPNCPRRIAKAHSPNCTGSGRSSPSWWLIMTICAGVALSPAMIAAGLPGARCRSKKTMTPTTAMTIRVENSRPAM